MDSGLERDLMEKRPQPFGKPMPGLGEGKFGCRGSEPCLILLIVLGSTDHIGHVCTKVCATSHSMSGCAWDLLAGAAILF